MRIQFQNSNLDKVKGFIKQYGYYALLAMSIVALTLIVVLSKPVDEGLPVGGSTVVFADPIANATVLKGYSADQLLFNQTLNQWEAHKAVSFAAEAGTNVMAAYDATVHSIYTNYMEGTVIVLNHGEGLKSLYGSLDAQVNVEVGDVVKKGDIIGKTSASAMSSFKDGPQLRFEVWEDNTRVDPAAYLASLEK